MTNCVKNQQILLDMGKDVVILDHHQGEHEHYPAIVVNNQLDDYPNKHLSGVGIVQKFCEAIDIKQNIGFSQHDLDLVAVGIVADVMRLLDVEQSYYVQKGLASIDNLLFMGIIRSNSYTLGDIDKLTPKHVSWNIAPLMNSVIRIGTVEEKRKLFETLLLEEDHKVQSTKRGNKPGDTEMLIAQTIRESNNIRARQKRILEKAQPKLVELTQEQNNIDTDKVLFTVVPKPKTKKDEIPQALTGLLAMNLTEHFGRPTMLLRDKDGTVSGSGRSTDEINNLRSMLDATNLTHFASGHEGAFGISLERNELERIQEVVNKQLEDMKLEVLCDFVFIEKAPTNQELVNFSSWNHIYGKGIEKPTFGFVVKITDLDKFEVLKKKKTVLKLKLGECEFVQFSPSEETLDIIMNPNGRTVLLTGTSELNTFYGDRRAQIQIDKVIEIDSIQDVEVITR